MTDVPAVDSTSRPDRCEVALLVPHPSWRAGLLCQKEGGPPSLPTVFTPPEPTVAAIFDAMYALLGSGVTPLQVRALELSDRFEPLSVLVETEPMHGAVPESYAWVDFDDPAWVTLQPALARPAVDRYLTEVVDGWTALRPAFSRPGWRDRASAWMVAEMAAAGLAATAPPRVYHLWDVSAVLRAPSDDGDLYLKCSADAFRYEAAVTDVLAARVPGLVPDVVAVEPSQGWLLMRDLAGVELGDQDVDQWDAGLDALAALQQAVSLDGERLRVDGMPERPLSTLAAEVAALSDDDELMSRLDQPSRSAWLEAGPSLVAACGRLADIGPGPTITHGDFHPWNVVSSSRGVRIFDWTDAALSHPFVDLATYVLRADEPDDRQRLLDTYLARWTGHLSEPLLAEAGGLALVVGALYQVQTYRRILPTLPPDNDLVGADADWMMRSVARHHEGLGAPR